MVENIVHTICNHACAREAKQGPIATTSMPDRLCHSQLMSFVMDWVAMVFNMD